MARNRPQVVVATACSLLQRFYYLSSLKEYPLQVIYYLICLCLLYVENDTVCIVSIDKVRGTK